jgi:FAD/FMN-containing dehydrogenase
VTDRLSTDLDVRRAYSRDASGLEFTPDAVARPADALEVAELLRDATSTRTAVTPAGAQSSTTGASIIITTCCCRCVGSIDSSTSIVCALGPRAGRRVDRRRGAPPGGRSAVHARPTSEEECTVGGAIACNASGARSLRYGTTGPHVRAITVALANGEIHELRRPALEKNTLGYPITHDPVGVVCRQ